MEEPTSYQINAAQISAYVNKARRSLARSTSNDPASQLESITRFAQEHSNNSGTSITNWEPIEDGDPPVSGTINGFFSDVELDSLILSNQLDVLQSAAINLHNLVKTDILRSVSENARLYNKLKTLQLYSSASDQSVVVFGDSFISDEFMDNSAFSGTLVGDVDGAGSLTLGRKDVAKNMLAGASVTILTSSNGAPGNNQEVESLILGGSEPGIPEFVGSSERRDSTKYMSDNSPASWFEYEAISISERDKKTANNLNFEYIDDMKLRPSADGKPGKIKWGDGTGGGPLLLEFEIKPKTPGVINALSFYAQEFKNKDNQPIKIKSVMISDNGANWVTLNPTDVWLTNDANLDNSVKSANLAIGVAKWRFKPQIVSTIRVSIEQNTPIDAKIGHVYYETKMEKKFVPKTITGADGKKEVTYVEQVVPAHRVEGPIPTISNTFRYQISNPYIGNLTSGVEFFNGKRWVIAIRDISVGEVEYNLQSTSISKKFQVPGVVDRVVLESDIEIPESYDNSKEWVKFYISPDDGITWDRISRVEDVYNDVPEIIAYNDPLPLEFREPNVGYHTTSGTVNSLRVKIELERPSDQPSTTPVVNGYRLKIRKQD